MGILDILAGRSPLLRSTQRRRTVASIEQDYAALASKGGGPFYVTSGDQRRYNREGGPTIDDIAAPRGTLSQEALDALLGDRDKTAAGVGFVTIILNPLGGAIGDYPVTFPFPTKKIWIASKTAAMGANALFISLDPLNKYPGGRNPAGNSVVPDGSEKWFDMTYMTTAGSLSGKLIKFGTAVRQVYATIGFENGGAGDTIITFGCSSDGVDDLSAQATGLATV